MKNKLYYLWLFILAAIAVYFFKKNKDLREKVLELDVTKSLQKLKAVRARSSVTDKEYQDAKEKYITALRSYESYSNAKNNG